MSSSGNGNDATTQSSGTGGTMQQQQPPQVLAEEEKKEDSSAVAVAAAVAAVRTYDPSMGKDDREEGSTLNLDFTKLRKVANCEADVLPAVAQNAVTEEVLMVGYVNRLALETALTTGLATFWSTSRNKLWIKGKTSGDYLNLAQPGAIRINCEQNSVLYRVIPVGDGTCHTNNSKGVSRPGCYYRTLNASDGRLEFLDPEQK